jgi:stearoyl-CoA desaturase (delta-9 desaturase)
MVNALAHTYGYRNFDTNDNSRNNSAVAYLVFGEGFQNNHHQFPARANFAVKSFEIDFGYWLCRFAARLGVLDVPRPS